MVEEERAQLIEEACGIFAVMAHEGAANLTCFGLHALQHRGQEAAGIATCEGGELFLQKRAGLISQSFDEQVLALLPGRSAIGHVRYSTSGTSSVRDAQPLSVSTRFGALALAHNGNFTNAHLLREQLEATGGLFSTECDTEALAHLIARSAAADMQGAIVDALQRIEGAFSLVGLTCESAFAVRDPHGVRPLVLGRLNGARVVASESSSFGLIGATMERELEPGELLMIHADGQEVSLHPFERVTPHPCVFELVYFARPDSRVFGREVYPVRKRMGQLLAEEASVEADVVIAVPDSGVPAALGFAASSGIPFEQGLVRGHYAGRTFIEPSAALRHLGVKLKLSPVRAILEGQRVVVVDDSLVRGTTSRKIVSMLRESGAREVHVRIASPPTRAPCFYGIDTASGRDLVAAHATLEQICALIGADSLAYLSVEGLREAVGATPDGQGGSDFCEACFTRRYPIKVPGRE